MIQAVASVCINWMPGIDLKKAPDLILKVKTKQETIFPILLGRQLNGLNSLKLLKQRLSL